MKKHTAYKYRIYPTKEQQQVLARTFGCCRFVWNNILDWRSIEYSVNGTKTNFAASQRRITELKQEYSFLKEVSSVALQQTIRNQDVAFSNFFKGQAKYPTFKKKHNRQSFRLINTGFRLKGERLFIAKIDTPIKVRWTRQLNVIPSSCTISISPAGKYFVSFCIEKESIELEQNNTRIGIDLGLTDFLVTSNGDKVKPRRSFKQHQVRLKRYQRVLSRRKKGGVNREKARLKVAKVHEQILNTRTDWLHKLSTKLIRENQSISLETLRVSNMIKNRRLSKHIADHAWSTFVSQLEYKAELYGRQIIKVSPWFPSSQLCSSCGNRDGKKELSVRKWTCNKCGASHDRDINAAININTAGHAEINDHGLSSSESIASNSNA